MSDDDYDRAAELAAIRARWQHRAWNTEDDDTILVTNDWSVLVDDPVDLDREVIRLAAHAPADIRTLLARLDALEDIEAERDAIARDAEAAVTALNAALGRLGEQRDSAYALLSRAGGYLERLPRAPESERLITAIHMQLGPGSARVDGLP